MRSLEDYRSGIDYSAIASTYGYKPVPDGFQPVTKTEVRIDWVKEEETAQNLHKKVTDFNPPEMGNESEIFLIDKSSITTNKGDFSLEIRIKPPQPGKNQALNLKLLSETGEKISDFTAFNQNNEWDLLHRGTSEAYRGNAIGGHMIKATENCIQAHADKTGEDQEIYMEASQLPVLSLFLRQGYEVVDKDQEEFQKIMTALESGDHSYVLASCEKDFEEGKSERKTWYVFRRDIYERMGREIWEYNEKRGKNNFELRDYAVRFRLHKKIKARNIAINGVRGDTATNLEKVMKPEAS